MRYLCWYFNLILFSPLGDMFGRKILFQGSVIVFLSGSIICGASPNMVALIFFRAFQGIGGGALLSLTQVNFLLNSFKINSFFFDRLSLQI